MPLNVIHSVRVYVTLALLHHILCFHLPPQCVCSCSLCVHAHCMRVLTVCVRAHWLCVLTVCVRAHCVCACSLHAPNITTTSSLKPRPSFRVRNTCFLASHNVLTTHHLSQAAASLLQPILAPAVPMCSPSASHHLLV